MANEQSKLYFASDFHLGIPAWHSDKAKAREGRVLRWLDMVAKDEKLEALYLVGDIFKCL
jgi:UDP-2,3-diacylglucosamine hydrolase